MSAHLSCGYKIVELTRSERHKTALVNASLAGGAAKDKQTSLADIKKIFGLDADDSEDEGL